MRDEKRKNDGEETEEKKDDEEEKEPTEDELEKDREQLEALIKSIKAVEEAKREREKRKGKRGMIAIEFGSIFHRNIVLNFMGYFMLNLTIIYTVLVLFDFGAFPGGLTAVVLFVLAYTFVETLFRMYLLLNHFNVVLRTLGFIFYFGYLTIFYLLNMYVFPQSVLIFSDIGLVVFVGMFIVFRYIVTQLIRNMVYRS